MIRSLRRRLLDRSPTEPVFTAIIVIGVIVVGRIADGGGLLGTDRLFGLSGLLAALAAIGIAAIAMFSILLVLPQRFTKPINRNGK